eukprot:96358_1
MKDLMKWWWLLSLVTVCTIGSVLIFIITIVNLFGFDACLTRMDFSHIVPKSVKWLSTLSLLSFIICCITQLFVVFALDNEGQVPSSIFQQVTQFIGLLSWTFAQLFIYVLFIFNLHISFKNTMLQISKRSLIFLTSSIILFCLFRIAYITLYTLYYNGIVSTHQAEYSLLIAVCGTEFIDLIVSIILIYLFIHRLFKLVSILPHKYDTDYYHEYTEKCDSYFLQQSITTKDTTTADIDLLINTKNGTNKINDENEENNECSVDVDSDESSISSGDTIFEQKQETILYVASKYAILSSIAIISTQFFLISAAVDALSFSDASDNGTGFYIVSFSVYFSMLSLDCFINALCICLNFEFNKICFWSICCICHDCCYSLCFRLSHEI